MDKKEDHYSASFAGLDCSLDHHDHHHRQLELMELRRIGEPSGGEMIDHLLNNPQQPHHLHHQHQASSSSSGFCSTTPTSLDKLGFADMVQFSDFEPNLALNQARISGEESGIDPVYFLKFPVLDDRKLQEQPLVVPQLVGENEERFKGMNNTIENGVEVVGEFERWSSREEEKARVLDNTSVQLQFLGDEDHQNKNPAAETKSKRKKPRTIKTSEEVESQRMTHIAVERNRRKQMNEHLRVLRSLMPGSYVQRGDQASILGGAIEFVRELEQLLQCLESQKRRRLCGEAAAMATQQPNHDQLPFFPPNLSLANDQVKLVDFETGLQEETAENRSCLADVEVKLLGFDAMIKILSRRRPGQLIKTIAALEDLQLSILHTNITTMEQSVLYSFNVKVAGESRLAAEDIASSVQQIFSFIHANSCM